MPNVYLVYMHFMIASSRPLANFALQATKLCCRSGEEAIVNYPAKTSQKRCTTLPLVSFLPNIFIGVETHRIMIRWASIPNNLGVVYKGSVDHKCLVPQPSLHLKLNLGHISPLPTKGHVWPSETGLKKAG